MELRRRRRGWIGLLVMLPVGLWLLYNWFSGPKSQLLPLAIAVTVAALGLRSLWRLVRPFRFEIGPSGLDVRNGTKKQSYAWHEIRTLTLSHAADAPATLDVQRMDADTPKRVLSFADVVDSPDDVAQVLHRHAGSRFVDLSLAGPETGGAFSIVLRGYDPATVDALLAKATQAMVSGDPAQRQTVAAALRGSPFPVVMRGYNRDQVDAMAERLAQQLAA